MNNMEIKTTAGQVIEFREVIDNFGWELVIYLDGTYIALSLTDEEIRKIKLYLERSVRSDE